MNATRNNRDNRRLLQGIMLALAIWGGLLSLGAFLFGYDATSGARVFSPSPARGLIVLTCVTVFLAFWGVLLSLRRRTLAARRDL